MYGPLLHSHWLLAWVALGLTAFALVKSFSASGAGKTSLFALIAAHLQLLLGLALWFLSPVVQEARANMGAAMKDSTLRFYLVEHFLTMVIAIVLITIAHRRTKAGASSARWFYVGALVLMLSRVPWERLLALPG